MRSGRRSAGRRAAEKPRRAGRTARAPRKPRGSLTLPRWWVAGLVGVVLVAALGVVVVVSANEDPCRAELVEARNPLLDPDEMREQPDERLDVLTAALGDLPAPFGEVVAGVGYDYDQWLRLYGLEAGLLAFTKNNAPVTLLDPDTLEPRWSLRPEARRTAWDASADRFVLLELSAHEDTRVSSYDVAEGARAWCAQLGQRHEDGEPVSTTVLSDGDLVAALPEDGRIVLTRLSGDTGEEIWSRDYASMARADHLGELTDDLLLVGGVEEFRLAEQSPDGDGGPMITAVDARDGTPAWSWTGGDDSQVHVIGVDGGRVVAIERSADGLRLFALDEDGEEQWSTEPKDLAFEATLRGGVVVMKSASALYGYDAATGELLWTETVPTDRTYFPYGFTLGQMPSLGPDHVLMPTTTDLVMLDVTDGSRDRFPIPVDGISTTYWPYQLAVTPDLIGVVTNTGGVVLRHEAQGPL